MLQQEGPDDFVLATGHMHSVREFVVAAFRYIGKEIEWEGAGDTEVGKEKGSGVVRYEVYENGMVQSLSDSGVSGPHPFELLLDPHEEFRIQQPNV